MNLKALCSRNLGLKLVSLVIASLFWLYVEVGRDGNSRVSVPVSIANLAPGLSLHGDIPDHVEMDLHGSRIDLMKVRSGNLRVVLDLSGVGEGVVSFVSLDKAVRLGHGVQTTRVYPSAIELKVTRK
jgi:YbbR domain-containing protein